MNNPLINPGIGVFFWMLISFGILVFILAKFGWPMMLKALKERETAIQESLDAAEKTREEMKHLQAHNEELLRQARLERDEILRSARETKASIIEEARLQATEEANRITNAAIESIQFEKLEAIHDLKNQIANLSIEIAEKLIQQELSDKEKANEVIRHQLEQTHLK